MNKSEIGERLAGRTGMSKAEAKDAVDGVFEAIAEALAKGDEVRIVGFGTYRAQPEDRREPVDRGLDRPGVQARQRTSGWRERGEWGVIRPAGRNVDDRGQWEPRV